jgi:DNA-binding CsgD family transcriptional regulator
VQNAPEAFSLQKHTILTNQEWEHFRSLFEKVHSGYLQRLKEKLPDLSPAEIRFMTLAKLNFSSKQMADTLGIGTDAVRMMRYRLRKKLNLNEEGSLEELIANI